jgi:hypothetical protein
MTAKTIAERQRAFKARMEAQGLTRCFVYAKPENHSKIKQFAKTLNDPEAHLHPKPQTP